MNKDNWPLTIILCITGFFGVGFIVDKWIDSNTTVIDVHKVFNEELRKNRIQIKTEPTATIDHEKKRIPVKKLVMARELKDCMKDFGGNEINNEVIECTKNHWIEIGYEVTP